MKIFCMRVMRTFVRNTQRILVSVPFISSSLVASTDLGAGIKEVVTLTSDLSRKNLEKDFERMDTPQGTFYRKPSLSQSALSTTDNANDTLQVSTLTSYLHSTARNSTPSSSAKAKLWAAAPLASGERTCHAHNENMTTAGNGDPARQEQ